MTTKKPKPTLDAIVEALASDFFDADFDTSRLDECLKARELHPESVRAEGRALIDTLREQRRLEWQEQARKQIRRRAALLEMAQRMPSLSRDALLAQLTDLRDARVAVAFRKRRPEESSTEELADLLQEIQMLRSIEEEE